MGDYELNTIQNKFDALSDSQLAVYYLPKVPSWLFGVVPTEVGSFSILLVDIAAGECLPSEINEKIIKKDNNEVLLSSQIDQK